MQFFNPSILIALLAMLVPIIVHLFKLRKFKKENFTNVAFLKKVEIESRKSAQLKKWLTLISRLLMLACIIFAFAKPYIPLENEVNEDTEMAVYIDNSFSMQAVGNQVTLLEEAKQALVNSASSEQKIHFITNTESFSKLDNKSFKNEVLNTSFTSTNTSLANKIQRAKSILPGQKNSRIIVISDVEGTTEEEIKSILDHDKSVILLQLQPTYKNNTWIEKVNLVGDFFNPTLQIEVKTNRSKEKFNEDVGISVLNGEEILARNTLNFEESNQLIIEIALPNNEIKKGVVQLESEGLSYDKEFFFSINKQPEIQIAHLYKNESANFIQRIFDTSQFVYTKEKIDAFDFSELSNTQILILDNLPELSKTQQNLALDFVSSGGSLVVIPAKEIDLLSYNEFFKSLNVPTFKALFTNEMLLTNIYDGHPLFEGVFEKKIENFDYPSVDSYFSTDEITKPVLAFSNGESFLTNRDNVYVFTANIHPSNSTFSKSPLVVPVFYQIGLKSMNYDKISLNIESNESISLPIPEGKEQVLKLISPTQTLIPNQQKLPNAIQLIASNYPSTAGHYEAVCEETSLGFVSFNYQRNQSDNQYLISTSFEHKQYEQQLSELKQLLSIQPKVSELWQWFLIFALIFMLIEILILRFIK